MKPVVGRVTRFHGGCKQPHRRLTSSLMAVNSCMHAAQGFSEHALTEWGMKSNHEIASGQWWRLITPALLHANLVHLASNSLALNCVGPLVEQESGAQRLLAVYVISTITSIAASCMQPKPSVGSSGAVFGVAGALAVFHYTHRHILEQGNMSLPLPVGRRMLWCLHDNLVINLKIGLVFLGIDMWCLTTTIRQVKGMLKHDSGFCRGHMGGLAGVALAAYLLGPKLVNAGSDACKKLFVDCPPVGWLARKGITRYKGMKCCCMRCKINGSGIQMRFKQMHKLKFSNRLKVISATK